MSFEALHNQIAGEPALRPLIEAAAARVGQTLELAIEKAVASQLHPAEYPLPAAAGCVERRLAAQLGALPRGVRRAVIDEFAPRLTEPAAARQQRYGALADIDLHRATPVLDAVRALGAAGLPRPDPTAVAALLQRLAPQLPPRGAGRARAASRLSIRLRQAVCVEKTRELLEGKDEMRLVVVPVPGAPPSPAAIELGQFKQGDARSFGDLEVASVALTDSTISAVSASFLLTEVDRGKLDATGTGDLVAVLLTAGFAAYTGALDSVLPGVAAVVGSDPAVLIALGAVAVGVVAVIGVHNLLDRWFSDDPFGLQQRVHDLPAPPAGPITDVVTFTAEHGKGRYELTFDWVLIAG